MPAKTDVRIVRELAKRYAESAADETNRLRIGRARNINSLKPERPIVWIDEIPWHEMNLDDELTLRCENEELRGMERFLRRSLYQWRHMQADMVLEDFYYVSKDYDSTGSGLTVLETTVAADQRNHIISHHYEDQLDTEEKLAGMRIPAITARPDKDEHRLALAAEVLEGILPVRLRGHGVYYAPWDDLSRLRGVEAILIDLAERPEFMHKTIARYNEIMTSQYEQMEAQELLDYNIQSLHCTPPYVEELPGPGYEGGAARFKNIWFRGMAQIFGSVSPAMHEEFELQYSRRLMDRCGLSYYGCCEPLDNKIDILKKIPNMRKIGVSPWANVRASAEAMGGRYVFARKPNPALVAGQFNEEEVRRETRETIEACLANKCPYEFVLKDISTVSYRPWNLFEWTRVVTRTIDEYYV